MILFLPVSRAWPRHTTPMPTVMTNRLNKLMALLTHRDPAQPEPGLRRPRGVLHLQPLPCLASEGEVVQRLAGAPVVACSSSLTLRILTSPFAGTCLQTGLLGQLLQMLLLRRKMSVESAGPSNSGSSARQPHPAQSPVPCSATSPPSRELWAVLASQLKQQQQGPGPQLLPRPLMSLQGFQARLGQRPAGGHNTVHSHRGDYSFAWFSKTIYFLIQNICNTQSRHLGNWLPAAENKNRPRWRGIFVAWRNWTKSDVKMSLLSKHQRKKN